MLWTTHSRPVARYSKGSQYRTSLQLATSWVYVTQVQRKGYLNVSEVSQNRVCWWLHNPADILGDRTKARCKGCRRSKVLRWKARGCNLQQGRCHTRVHLGPVFKYLKPTSTISCLSRRSGYASTGRPGRPQKSCNSTHWRWIMACTTL